MDGPALGRAAIRPATVAEVRAEIAELRSNPGRTQAARNVAVDRIALLVHLLPTGERTTARMSRRWMIGMLDRAQAVLADPARRAAVLGLGPMPDLVTSGLSVSASTLVDESVSPLELLRGVRGMDARSQALRQRLMTAAWADGASAAEIAEAIAAGPPSAP